MGALRVVHSFSAEIRSEVGSSAIIQRNGPYPCSRKKQRHTQHLNHDEQESEHPMRLQKYLALCGVASRRTAEKMIQEGRVAINGSCSTEMGQLVQPEDQVTVDGKLVTPEKEKHYIAYYKPWGEVTTAHDPEGRPTVMDKFRDYPVRLFPVGRLDYDSEGLLLLTNDGELMNELLHPSRLVDKVYWVKVSNQVQPEELVRLKAGVMVEGRLTSPAKVRLIRTEAFDTVLLITIHEGRNRQVRKMVEVIGHQVVNLKRVGFASIQLGDLPRGQWRELTPAEVAKLKGQ